MNPEQKNEDFNHYGLHTNVIQDIATMGYDKPTPIQAQCIHPALKGQDVIGLAQTGTGKTVAFGLPIIQHVARKMEMLALILTPTRELAQQVVEVFNSLGKSSGVRTALLVGGVPIKEDYRAIRAWPNVIVATPGRLIEHIYSRTINLSEIEILAVDEADRMYDMGFLPQIKQIIDVLPSKRQTLMFTATMPKQVENLVRRHMNAPVRIQVGTIAPAAKAKQMLFRVNEQDKLPLLLKMLNWSKGRVLIFVRTKRQVEQLARKISRQEAHVARLHGDCEQKQREVAMAGFRDGKYRILIATDIAARGIDIVNIKHVVNYDFPGSAEDYIHRIGRTARVAASGLATSFVTKQDLACVSKLGRMIPGELSLIPLGSYASEQPESIAVKNLRQPAHSRRDFNNNRKRTK